MKAHIVIGKNFGDEGKGLATDYFSGLARKADIPCLVIRHNGGAQAGHTVDQHDKRFVFHQLSSGSFHHADTFWADTFLPDLYKLPEETERFFALNGDRPRILSFGNCRCVLIDDVLLNMALETSRGDRRHGSCGMGIDEAVQRSVMDEFRITPCEVKSGTGADLHRKLAHIRREYLPQRLEKLGLSLDDAGEYGELLCHPDILYHVAEGMCRGAEQVEIIGPSALSGYGEVVFEGAQGLLLDEMYLDYAPHLTSSRTGLQQPLMLCSKLFPDAFVQAVYVTRSYVTRHGMGPLPHENQFDKERYPIRDLTNMPNEWQGSLRLAVHGTYSEFMRPVLADLRGSEVSCAIFVTHLNETENRILTLQGAYLPTEWIEQYHIDSCFDTVYLSGSPYSCDIRKYSGSSISGRTG